MAKTSKPTKKAKKAPSLANKVAPSSHNSSGKRVSALGRHMERAKGTKESK